LGINKGICNIIAFIETRCTVILSWMVQDMSFFGSFFPNESIRRTIDYIKREEKLKLDNKKQPQQ
jgi:hypothetical protein